MEFTIRQEKFIFDGPFKSVEVSTQLGDNSGAVVVKFIGNDGEILGVATVAESQDCNDGVNLVLTAVT